MPKLTKKQMEIQEWQDTLKAESDYRNNYYEYIIFFIASLYGNKAIESIEIMQTEDYEVYNGKVNIAYVFIIKVKNYSSDSYEPTYIRQWDSLNDFNTNKYNIMYSVKLYNDELNIEGRKRTLRENALTKLSQEEIDILGLSWCE